MNPMFLLFPAGGDDDEDDEDDYDSDSDNDTDADTDDDDDYADDDEAEAPEDADYGGFSLAGLLDELDDDVLNEYKWFLYIYLPIHSFIYFIVFYPIN